MTTPIGFQSFSRNHEFYEYPKSSVESNTTISETDNEWVYVHRSQVNLLGCTSEEMKDLTAEEIEDFFQNYVSLSCPKYSKETVSALINEGQRLLIAIKNNAAENIPHQQRRQWMAPLVWTLMFNAHKQGQAFEQGMFVFDDPDHKLVNFFSVVATSRPSSHFNRRREDSWGIDVEQNYRTGLPANHQTAHFGRLREDHNGQKRSFLKPENWGMETWWQWLRHAMDYMWTRVHNPTDEMKRKEHCPSEVRNCFKVLYAELTHHSDLPPDIDTFGISEMVRFLMHYLETNPQNEQLYLIPPFLAWLDKNYPDIPNLDRQGNEVILSESLLFDEVMIASSAECDYKKFLAFLKLKTATEPEEIVEALTILSTFKADADWMPQPTMIPDNIAVYDRKGDKKKEAILYQLNADLNRSNNLREEFLLNGEAFTKGAENLFYELRKYIKTDDHALNAMTLMTQGVKEAMTTHMMTIMHSPIPGLAITSYSGSSTEKVAEVNVWGDTDRVLIDIWVTYALRGSDCGKPTFKEQPYAMLKGWTQVNFPTDPDNLKETFAYTKWAIEEVL